MFFADDWLMTSDRFDDFDDHDGQGSPVFMPSPQSASHASPAQGVRPELVELSRMHWWLSHLSHLRYWILFIPSFVEGEQFGSRYHFELHCRIPTSLPRVERVIDFPDSTCHSLHLSLPSPIFTSSSIPHSFLIAFVLSLFFPHWLSTLTFHLPLPAGPGCPLRCLPFRHPSHQWELPLRRRWHRLHPRLRCQDQASIEFRMSSYIIIDNLYYVISYYRRYYMIL